MEPAATMPAPPRSPFNGDGRASAAEQLRERALAIAPPVTERRNWGYYYPAFEALFSMGHSYRKAFEIILEAEPEGWLKPEDYKPWARAMGGRTYTSRHKQRRPHSTKR